MELTQTGDPKRLNGSGAVHVRLRDRPLDGGPIERFAQSPDNGGLCIFKGVVRRDDDLSPVQSLEYDGYRQMACRQLEQIAGEAAARWPGLRVAVEHRLGTVPLGEPSVIIAVGAPHRAEAFAGCRYLIEELKCRVPIWKKEIAASGSRWVEGTPADAAAGKPSGEGPITGG